LGWNTPKTPIVGAWIFTIFCKILKDSYYRNYCSYFTQILHNDRDHQVVVVSGPNRAQQIQDGGRPPFCKKTVESPYLCNRLTHFNEIWHDGAYWPLTVDRPLKFRIFENPRWRRSPSWKITKLRYLYNGLTDLYKMWYGATENARLEISAPSKMQGWKMRDWNYRHQTAGVENEGPSSRGKPKHIKQ